jgi:Fe-S-cluster containining protein
LTSCDPESAASPAPWYADGLTFGCTRCGACCRKEGFVWLSPQDTRRLAEHLNLTTAEFRAQFTREIPSPDPSDPEPGIALKRAPHGCVFLDDATNECRVHPARPLQCRAFPFWPMTIASPEAWHDGVVALCGEEAVTTGRLFTPEEITWIAGHFIPVGKVDEAAGPPREGSGD